MESAHLCVSAAPRRLHDVGHSVEEKRRAGMAVTWAEVLRVRPNHVLVEGVRFRCVVPLPMTFLLRKLPPPICPCSTRDSRTRPASRWRRRRLRLVAARKLQSLPPRQQHSSLAFLPCGRRWQRPLGAHDDRGGSRDAPPQLCRAMQRAQSWLGQRCCQRRRCNQGTRGRRRGQRRSRGRPWHGACGRCCKDACRVC